jgi:hypothetical protein
MNLKTDHSTADCCHRRQVFFGKLADMFGAIQAYMIASLWQTVLVFGFI